MRGQVLPAMTQAGPIVAWIVDDTGLPKKGTHSVGAARQYCGQTGKQDNCQVAVSLSVATWKASLPIAYRLYLPEVWAHDRRLRQRAKIPAEIPFQTKLEIALGQKLRRLCALGRLLIYCLVEPLQRRIKLIEHTKQLLSSPARPRIQVQPF